MLLNKKGPKRQSNKRNQKNIQPKINEVITDIGYNGETESSEDSESISSKILNEQKNNNTEELHEDNTEELHENKTEELHEDKPEDNLMLDEHIDYDLFLQIDKQFNTNIGDNETTTEYNRFDI